MIKLYCFFSVLVGVGWSQQIYLGGKKFICRPHGDEKRCCSTQFNGFSSSSQCVDFVPIPYPVPVDATKFPQYSRQANLLPAAAKISNGWNQPRLQPQNSHVNTPATRFQSPFTRNNNRFRPGLGQQGGPQLLHTATFPPAPPPAHLRSLVGDSPGAQIPLSRFDPRFQGRGGSLQPRHRQLLPPPPRGPVQVIPPPRFLPNNGALFHSGPETPTEEVPFRIQPPAFREVIRPVRIPTPSLTPTPRFSGNERERSQVPVAFPGPGGAAAPSSDGFEDFLKNQEKEKTSPLVTDQKSNARGSFRPQQRQVVPQAQIPTREVLRSRQPPPRPPPFPRPRRPQRPIPRPLNRHRPGQPPQHVNVLQTRQPPPLKNTHKPRLPPSPTNRRPPIPTIPGQPRQVVDIGRGPHVLPPPSATEETTAYPTEEETDSESPTIELDPLNPKYLPALRPAPAPAPKPAPAPALPPKRTRELGKPQKPQIEVKGIRGTTSRVGNPNVIDNSETTRGVARPRQPPTPRVTKPRVPPTPRVTKPRVPPAPRVTKPRIPPTPRVTKPRVPPTPRVTKPSVPPTPRVTKPRVPPTPRVTKSRVPLTPRVTKSRVPPTPRVTKPRPTTTVSKPRPRPTPNFTTQRTRPTPKSVRERKPPPPIPTFASVKPSRRPTPISTVGNRNDRKHPNIVTWTGTTRSPTPPNPETKLTRPAGFDAELPWPPRLLPGRIPCRRPWGCSPNKVSSRPHKASQSQQPSRITRPLVTTHNKPPTVATVIQTGRPIEPRVIHTRPRPPTKPTLAVKPRQHLPPPRIRSPLLPPFPQSPHNTKCFLDLMLIMDASGSVRLTFQKQLDLAVEIVDRLTLRNSAAKVALISYAGPRKARVVVGFQDNEDKASIMDKIRSLNHVSGTTETGEALLVAAEEFSQKRSSAKSVAILLTDGYTASDTALEARTLRDQGVVVFALAIDEFRDQAELEKITGNPSRVFTSSTFVQFQQTLDKLTSDCAQ